MDDTLSHSRHEHERLLNAVEVSTRLRVSERWVRDHATRRSPRLPVVKLGSLLRFRPEDVDRFIDKQRNDHSGTSRIQ
jgi:predicted DNA-binding transcriptional regulator AlpA